MSAEIDAAFAALSRAVADAAAEHDRLAHVRACIYVNAIRCGATTEEANAYADGTSPRSFIDFMAEYVQSQSLATGAGDAAEERGDG